MFLLVSVSLLTSCSSKEDKLIGTWSRSFSKDTPYTDYRTFSLDNASHTYYHTISFEKGKSGKGTFTDVVTPLSYSVKADQIVVGSKVTGNWEVKDGKLFLFYNDDLSLTNDNNLDADDIEELEMRMSHLFFEDYERLGEKGLSYKFIEKNDKVGLEIDFGNDDVVFSKKADKED